MIALQGGPLEFDGIEVEIRPGQLLIERDDENFVTHYWWVDYYYSTEPQATRYHDEAIDS